MRMDPQKDKICDKSIEWMDPTGVKQVTSPHSGRILLEGQESQSSMRTDPQEDNICDKSTEWTDPTGVK